MKGRKKKGKKESKKERKKERKQERKKERKKERERKKKKQEERHGEYMLHAKVCMVCRGCGKSQTQEHLIQYYFEARNQLYGCCHARRTSTKLKQISHTSIPN